MYSEIPLSLFNDTFLPLDRLPQKYQDGLTTEHLSRIGNFSEVHVTSYEESLAEDARGTDENEYARSFDSDSDAASELSVLEDDERRDIYKPMCGVFNRLFEVLEAPYAMTVTGNSPRARREPELCMYPAATRAAGEQESVDIRTNVSWTSAVTYLEVKTRAAHAPFNYDTDPLVEPDTPEAQTARTQLADHVAEVMRHQHRLFLFMVAIQSDRARLMRWDRAGVVVSHAFNYKENPLPLLDFVFRLAVSERAEQGYDLSVRPATQAEIELLEQYHSRVRDAWLKEAMEDILSDPERYPVHAITCPDLPIQHGGLDLPESGTERTHVFLVGRFRTAPRSPTGRGAKTYVAYDVDRSRVAFLKDAWIPDHPQNQPESAVYCRLHAAGVQHIATAYAGGVVPGNTTLDTKAIEGLMNAPGRKRRRIMLLHDRIVVKEIGRPLNTFVSAEHLVKVIYEAFQGHKEAWEKARILHGDISSGNILINCETDEGLLIDWDLCKAEENLGKGSTQQGTWIFMSSLLLNFPLKPHSVSDDLESFVHVLMDQILRYFKHNLSSLRLPGSALPGVPTKEERRFTFEIDETQTENTALADHYQMMYLTSSTLNGLLCGSPYKWSIMQAGRSKIRLNDGNGRMSELLTELHHLFGEAYSSLDEERLEDVWRGQRALNVAPPIIPTAINTHKAMDDILRKFYERACNKPGWGYRKTEFDQVQNLRIYGQHIIPRSTVRLSTRD